MLLQEEKKEEGFGSSSSKQSTQDMLAYANSIDLAKLGLRDLGEQMRTSFSPDMVIKTKLALEELTTTMVRETMGQTKAIAEGIETTVAKATFETSLFGISAEDNLQLISEMSQEMQVVTLLTSEQVTNMQLLGRSMGVASKDMATLVRGFSDIGVGTDQAIENINTMSKQARAYGINVSQFMGKISENIKRISTYNFKDGVDGFTKMIAKAQSLRIDVGSTFKLAESLMDPAKAIEMAAGFQMVGGAVGALGDPFKLLHMAQNDVAGLQDELLKASESAVSFNEETGEFDIAVTEMYRLREMAQMTGKSYEEIADEAIKAKKRTEKLNLLENSVGNFSDEQKELISNFGQIVKDGRGGVDLKVQIPGMDELVDAEDLTPEQIAKLEDLQRENAKSEIDVSKEIRDINKEQLSVLKAREGLDYQIQTISTLITTQTPAIGDLQDVFRQGTVSTSEAINDSFTEENTRGLGMTLSDAIDKGFKSSEANMALENNINTLVNDITTQFSNIPTDVRTKLRETDNMFKDSNPLETISDVLGKFVGDTNLLDVSTMSSQLSLMSQGIRGFLNSSTEHLEQRTEQRTEQRRQVNTNTTDTLNTQDANARLNEDLNEVQQMPIETQSPVINNNLQENNNSNENNDVNRVTEGEIKVNGTIDLKLNGMDLEKIDVVELTKNAEFRAKVRQIALDEGNTYR